MKKISAKLLALLTACVLLTGLFVPAVIAETATVESVTAQLEAIHTLQQMQDNRSQYKASGQYDYLNSTTYKTSHETAQKNYATYIADMMAARAAAQQAYDALSPEEQAQIDPALVAKLNNTLETTMLMNTYSVTPRDDEYVFEAVKGEPGLGYEVSTEMVAQEIPQTFIVVDTSDGKTEWTPSGKYVSGESNYEVMYCCDIDTGLKWGADYRRINLEDSPYFGAESAAHIRSIVQNSYPYITIDEMKARMKADGLSASFVDSLTRNDIISAVQMAIWQFNYNGEFDRVTHGYFGTISLQANTGSYFTPLHDTTNEVWEWLPAKKQRTYYKDAEYRVNNLIYYLCGLEGVAPAEDCIAISEVQIGRLDLIPRSNGLYNIGLQVALNVGCQEGDNVTLKVTSYSIDADGNRIQTASNSMRVGKDKTYAMSINARYGDTIEVTAEGTQQLDRGVYFYEAEGGPTVSQSLVAVSSGQNPVYAVQKFTFEEDIEMGLRIYKKSSVDQAPISDITFDVYKVEPADGEELNDVPTEEEIAKYATTENLVGSVTTDITGYAALALDSEGTYLVVEQHNADKVVAPADPFYITIPWPVETEIEGENGTETVIEYRNVVSVYPKNTPVTPPPPPPPPPPENIDGTFTIIKHDSNDQTDVLAGAEFQVYRPATSEDTDIETLLCDGLRREVVPVIIDGAPLILTTDERGSAVSPKLPCGVYYIKETKAPLGYVLPKWALSVTVTIPAVQETAYVYVGNDRGIVLPETGGIGISLFLMVGGSLVMMAALLFVTKRRLNRQ